MISRGGFGEERQKRVSRASDLEAHVDRIATEDEFAGAEDVNVRRSKVMETVGRDPATHLDQKMRELLFEEAFRRE